MLVGEAISHSVTLLAWVDREMSFDVMLAFYVLYVGMGIASFESFKYQFSSEKKKRKIYAIQGLR